MLWAINRQKWLCVLLHPALEWEFLTLNPKLKQNCLTSVFYYLTFRADKSIFFPLKRNKAIREPGNALSPSQDSHPKACITFFLLLCACLVMWLRDSITGSSMATTENTRDMSCLPKEENPRVRYINKDDIGLKTQREILQRSCQHNCVEVTAAGFLSRIRIEKVLSQTDCMVPPSHKTHPQKYCKETQHCWVQGFIYQFLHLPAEHFNL